jgi:hypothetical protein
VDRFCREAGGRMSGEVVAQTMYTHCKCKCKNDKIKERKKRKKKFLS